MGYRVKQRFFTWGISNGWEAPKEMFNIFSHQGNLNQTALRFHLTPVRMAKIKISGDSRCWRDCGERGTLLHCWWNCKLVQSLWKSFLGFLWKLGIILPEDLATQLLGIHPEDSLACNKGTCYTMFLIALFIVARSWKELRCPSTEEWTYTFFIPSGRNRT